MAGEGKFAMAGERILIVDDSKYMVSFLAETALPALGYQPLVATTGKHGLEQVAGADPDLVLLDFNLPDMNGMDVVRQLAAAGNQTPVILMTAHGSEKVAVEAFRLGVRDYLTKPVELDEVAESIERALYEVRLKRDKRQLAQELHRANAELRRQVDQVATFISIGRAVTALLDLNEILTRVIDAAIQLCRAEEATIWLREGTDDELIMVAEKGVDQKAIRLPRMRVQDGLAGEAVRTRRPIRQTAGDTGGIKVKTGYLVQSVMYVPLLIQERCLGVISVANRRSPRAFNQVDQESLEVLADYAAIAIENARLYKSMEDSLQKGLRELAAVSEISEAVATLDLKVLLRRAMNRIHQAFDVSAATLFLADDSQTHLHFTLSSNPGSRGTLALKVPFGEGLVGSCVLEGTGLFSNDPYNHAHFVPEIDTITGFEAQSVLAVPLTIKSRIIGAIELLNKQSGPFDMHDVSLLRAMGMPMAVAVDNARLFEQIERERATLKAVMEGGANPILIVDQGTRLLLCNPAAEIVFGLSTEDMRRDLAEVTGIPRLAELVAQGNITTNEISVHNRIYLTSIAPVAKVGSVIVMQDITYLKELDRAKSDFVTAVTHDLRSPLTAITGFIDLLRDAGPLNEQQNEFVSHARQSTAKMRRLIDDLLDLAKIEAGLGASTTTCDLYAIAEEVVAELQGAAIQQHIQLSVEKKGDVPEIHGDPNRLRRAIANLVGNALKYTPEGGTVRVDLEVSDGRVLLAVVDSGRGIPKDDMPYIFDPFYRVAEHQDVDGSGLGLAMVKSIVDVHGGTISVNSQVGQGSQFTISLPAPA
jgi:signal transduction histidine kinase/DNA-binding response OmpR family regulator